MRKNIRWWMAVALGIVGAAAALAQQNRLDRIMVVPRESAVTIDGDLKEWDLSGAVDAALDQKLRPLFSVKLAAMYDAEALYIGAHFMDDTPLLNRHDPRVEGAAGWAGDCLQLYLCSDVAQPYPLPGGLEIPSVSTIMMWHYTDNREPVLFVGSGPITAKQVQKFYIGKESDLAFKPDADGKGYTLEARLTWARLHAPRPPKAGERMAFMALPFWGSADGYKHAAYFNEIVREAGFGYASLGMWGQALFLEKGHLTAEAKPKTATERQLPVTTKFNLPDRKATTVSAAIYNSSNAMVRTLLAGSASSPQTGASAQPMDTPLYGARIVKRDGAKLEVAWDGCDDKGHPLPAGDYSVKLLTSRGIGQKWIASAFNAGNPPWHTDDGTGSWGGCGGLPPIGAASDAERVYLIWPIDEGGSFLIACTPDGRKLWGASTYAAEAGMFQCAVATDGKFVYGLQDGYMPGTAVGTPGGQCRPAIVRWDAATGKPANFPFGKRCLLTGDWPASLMPPNLGAALNLWWSSPSTLFPKRTWERLKTHDFGPQELAFNAIGLAVHSNTAYVAKYLENKAAAFDLSTGKQVREWNVPSPAGMAATTDGTIYAVSGKGVVKLLPDGAVAPVVKDALSSPWGLAIGKDGLIYVSDCGDAMQVKVFNMQGQFVRTIGKPGGRPWVGKYEAAGMLKPAGLTLDRDGKLWVCEYDNSPRRISTWMPDGSFHKEYFGPATYSGFATVDEEHPNLVCTHNTMFDVNYRTGTVKPVSTFTRDVKGLQFQPYNQQYLFRQIKGRTYAISMDMCGSIVYLVTTTADGATVGEPVAAWGMLNHLRFTQVCPADLPAKGKELWANAGKVMYQWHDLNGDRTIQDDEWTFTPADQTKVKSTWMLSSGAQVDDDLTFWTWSHNNQALSIKVKEWRGAVPIYEPFSEVTPLFKTDGLVPSGVWRDENALYLTRGGPFCNEPGELARYTLDGRRVWAYGRAFSGLATPLPAAGDVVSYSHWRNLTRTPDGLGLLYINGYYGQYFLLDTDGLYVGTLCKDSRTGPKCGPDVVLMENFNGFFYRNKDNGKYYALGGDQDMRIWEVTGVDTLRKSAATLTICSNEGGSAGTPRPTEAQAFSDGRANRPGEPIRVWKVTVGFKPANVAAWDMTKAVTWDAGAGRAVKVALTRDDTNLYALYQVTDSSPMANSGKDMATIFKCGDTCEIMLAAEPGADPKRVKPAAGDMRILFSAMEGRPLAALFEAVVRPGENKEAHTFTSSTGAEAFERVVQLTNAVVNVARTADAYVLSATVPLKDLGFTATSSGFGKLTAGLKTKGDVGVLFSNDGGIITALRSYYFNHNTGITGDLPSEARLQPADWGTVEVE